MRATDFRFVAFDVETTGLQAFGDDRVIQFGAIEFGLDIKGNMVKHRSFDILVNPKRRISPEVTDLTGISNHQVANAPVFKEQVDLIQELLSGAVILGHNLSFDIGFIRSEFSRLGLPWPQTYAEIDTLLLARSVLPELSRYKLEMIANFFKIPLNAHRAEDDAIATAQVFCEMIKLHKPSFEQASFLDWARASTQPPKDQEYIGIGPVGLPIFLEGDAQGQLIEDHTLHLSWMMMAKVKREGQWKNRFPQNLRDWVSSWLRAKASGSSTVVPSNKKQTNTLF